ncbi:MAG: hypothetical protein A3D65_01190 [Candidatus Lloydbacteria bacterium RIFCSPHIGHO2_02_FULL_50_13]|uniref:Uncharacterized protein n=1 Tax=Candidatus Lloydbacteria bacterium RIFCSPHIGHO2_02_FULL_50_13 TaxID=1798661 RepID=A0A1G2D4V7_9BACT|nr:MAG: hypothetical protein A3D65_01190 [Candidatus Lloydbacteria bacterium RIFCSPHIGHO2_02_FULL_50_13]
MNAKIEFTGYFWQLTLPCGDKVTVSDIDAKVPQVCPKCKTVFAHFTVTRVPMPKVAEPQRVRC